MYIMESIVFVNRISILVLAATLTVEVETKVAQGSLFLLGAGAFIVNVECHQSSFMAHNVGNGGARYSGTKEEGNDP